MPFRTPINTDAARINTGERCLMQHENDKTAAKSLVSDETTENLRQNLLPFKSAVTNRGKEAADQMPAVAAKDESRGNCRMWISHFFHGLNNWIKRELHDEGLVKYYGLDVTGSIVPPLYSDDDVLLWGDRLLKGETQRVADGGKPMTNPSAEDFRSVYEDYTTKLQATQKEKSELDTAEETVAKLRPAMDEALEDVIAELEFNLRKVDTPSRRRKLRTYGIKYSYRAGETQDEDELNV